MEPSFSDLSEEIDDARLPWLDRKDLDASETVFQYQRDWRKNGFVILKKFMPENLMDAYCKLRERLQKPGGWQSPVPYMYYDEIKDICLYEPLSTVLRNLIGEEMGLHLNLTGWISTEREWHQDDYLNPDFMTAHYLAVWITLDRVDPNSGPFEFIRGSHTWPLLRRHKLAQYMDLTGPDWPTRAEKIVTPACLAEIQKRRATPEQFLGERGDVLIWHGRLLHQGSKPKIPGTPRKALIAHYSAVSRRKDMPNHFEYVRDDKEVRGTYFHLPVPMDESERI